MKFQMVKITVTPGQNPLTEKVGSPGTDRVKLQNDADSRNRNAGDRDFDPNQPLVTYGVEIVRG